VIATDRSVYVITLSSSSTRGSYGVCSNAGEDGGVAAECITGPKSLPAGMMRDRSVAACPLSIFRRSSVLFCFHTTFLAPFYQTSNKREIVYQIPFISLVVSWRPKAAFHSRYCWGRSPCGWLCNRNITKAQLAPIHSRNGKVYHFSLGHRLSLDVDNRRTCHPFVKGCFALLCPLHTLMMLIPDDSTTKNVANQIPS